MKTALETFPNAPGMPVCPVSIVIPVHNQLSFTRNCLATLRSTVGGDVAVVVVDNGSSDGTREYLAGFPEITVVQNSRNLGCATAWNQGVLVCRADWVVILNNDVLLTAGWLDGLRSAAEQYGLDIVSPAIREGLLNYELEPYARDFVRAAAGAMRAGEADGICFMVRRRVFDQIGGFDENFRIGVFEDADFFERARRAGFRLGTTGRSFIHHFGSVTQKSLRHEPTVPAYESEGRAYFRQKWRLTRWQRWLRRWRNNLKSYWWRLRERRKYGHTLRERWRRGRLVGQ